MPESLPEHSRCRLCTANDLDALAEELAEKTWASRRDREIDPEWSNAGPYWQTVMRDYARLTLDVLRADHG